MVLERYDTIDSMNSDTNTNISELKNLLLQFRDQRDWDQFHDPKNLAEAISIESSELLELFLWKNSEEVERLLKNDKKFRKAVEEEFADIVCFILNFANATQIEVSRAVRAKIKLNEKKYPVAKAKGRATKYDQL